MVEILTIGDEILMGQVVNSNAAFLGEMLTDAGIHVGWATTVGDRRDAILAALKAAAERASAVIITGGLGPTPDDLTKPCLVEFFQDRLELRDDLLAAVVKRFERRGLPFPEESRGQAEFPAGAQVIPNPDGTAVGIHYIRNRVEWFALPGVPLEMRNMATSYVLPRLLGIGLGGNLSVRVLRTTGIGESFLMRRLTRLHDAASLVEVAFLPRYFGVDLKLTARGADSAQNLRRLDQAEALLKPDLAGYFYAYGSQTLAEAVGKRALASGVTLAVAESCTGGLIARQLTDVPGSSAYFERGVVAYSNRAKTELLGVPSALIEKHGAVSEEVAVAMAQGLLKRSPVQLAVSVTGIAGPTGGTEEKPVGLTFIAAADARSTTAQKHIFSGDRDANRRRAAAAALKLIFDCLENYGKL
jgi:nicotinamide-nucleotide amidase